MNDHHFNYKTQILKKTLDFITPHNTIQGAFVLKLLKNVGIHHYHKLYHFQLELKMAGVFFDYIYNDLIT
jgi:hypothetical protein